MQRRFLPFVISACGVLLFGITIAGAQVVRDRQPAVEPARTVQIYEGVSRRGVLQEALEDAVNQAGRALPGADRLVQYRVREITGESGGIVPVNTVRVSIEVFGPEQPRFPSPGGVDGVEPDRGLVSDLELTDQRVPRAGSVGLQLRVRNTTEDRIVLPFSSGQRFDFVAVRDGRVVWRWSEGRAFTQALGSVRLEPGETVTYRANWDLRNNQGVRVPPGQYVIRGFLTTRGQNRAEETATLTVTER